MTLKRFSKRTGLHYKTVYSYWQKDMLNAFQLPTGQIIVDISDTDPLENAFKCKVVTFPAAKAGGISTRGTVD